MMPVEIKSHVEYHNFDCARQRLKKVLGADWYFSHLTYYFCMKADDSKLLELIGDNKNKSRFTSKAYQMLHHAYVYIESKSKLLYVVEVEFPQSLLEVFVILIIVTFLTIWIPDSTFGSIVNLAVNIAFIVTYTAFD